MFVELLIRTLEERGKSDTNHQQMFQNVNMFMKLTNLSIALLLMAILSIGCTSTIKRSGQMHPGMTRPEVIATLGEPHSTMSPGGNVEILRYVLTKQRLYRLAVPLKYDYLVRLENGQVIMYGSESDLIAAAAASATRPDPSAPTEKTININVRTEGSTNTVSPVQPQLHLREP
jgi:outer membrane protein assembly factor BamE (lipoprotein component of BamABCDE complex)